MKKAILFVDANNFYHNTKKWIKPSSIDIWKIARLIEKEKNLEIKEIRWYVSMPDKEANESIYQKQRSFLSHLEHQGVKIITRKLQKLSNKELVKKRQILMDSWDLCEVCKPLVEEGFMEIKDPNQKEKGIDVWIAIDMLKESFQNNLDCCILFSGDADFVPAGNLIKEIGKKFLSCSVLNGYSNELRQKFEYILIKREDLNKCLKIKQ
jgi:uncharacterized LabA/DUF88 family protein